MKWGLGSEVVHNAIQCASIVIGFATSLSHLVDHTCTTIIIRLVHGLSDTGLTVVL